MTEQCLVCGHVEPVSDHDLFVGQNPPKRLCSNCLGASFVKVGGDLHALESKWRKKARWISANRPSGEPQIERNILFSCADELKAALAQAPVGATFVREGRALVVGKREGGYRSRAKDA